MSKLTIALVPINLLDHMLPKCIDHIKKVVEKAPTDVSLEATINKLRNGDAGLITISDGEEVVAINTLQVETYETGYRVLCIPITGGSRMEEWTDEFLDLVTDLAKEYKCSELRGIACRPGWLRYLKEYGWETVHTIVRCKVEA